MDIITISILIGLGMILFSAIATVAIIAGPDIIRAFKRKFQPAGCEVYIANDSRGIRHYYRKPSENHFRINDTLYITNPDKLMNFSEEERKHIKEHLKKNKESKKKKLGQLKNKIQTVKRQKKQVEERKKKMYLQDQLDQLVQAKEQLEKSLVDRQENYFQNKRPAFFYVEGDPIPKDLHDFPSGKDSKILDNMMSRAQTENPQEGIKETLEKLRWWILASAGAAGVAAFLSFQILNKMGGGIL